MAKFNDLHLLLQEEQRILFGDDSLGMYGPSVYPAAAGSKPFMGFTTISGYNTTYPGMGVSNIASTSQLVVSVPLAGERATQDYHLVRYDQLQDVISDEASSDWQDSVLSYESNPPGSPSDGDRYIVEPTASGVWLNMEDSIVEWNTASGTWDVYPPNEGFTTFVEDEDKYYVYYNGSWAPMGEGIDHGDLIGLDDDDHPQYILVDGSRGFTGTVSGIAPTDGSDLVTKDYVDNAIGGQGPFVTISGNESIYGDKVFDNTLTTFLGDVFFNGIEITMSGTTLNTESGATFNYDSSTTINNDATNNFTDNASITTSGTDINFGTGTTVNYEDGSTETHESGSTETYEGGSNTVHENGSVDTYEDGAILTFSGTDITYEGDTTIDVNGDTVTNYNDNSVTNFNSGSEVTFSGTTVFDSPTTFNNDIYYGDNTISGTGDIYAGNIYADNIINVNQKWGRIACIDGNRNQAVTFGTAWPDDDYTVVATLTNEVDAKPSIYSTIQGVKAASGFTTHFSGKIDSSNYILEWHAFYGQQN